MLRLLISITHMQFWAAPHHSMDVLENNWGSVWSDRHAVNLKAQATNFPGDDPAKPVPPRPVKPIPTDVPVPDPHDVPIPEPIDIPAPEPNVIPPGAKPPKHNGNDPKPRPVP
jgi:hypothetical protein